MDRIGFFSASMKKILPLLAIAMLASCAGEKQQLSYEMNAAFSFAGPLFEGSNTAEAVVVPALDSFIKANGLAPEQLASVKISSVSMTSDSGNFDLAQSVTLSMASEAAKMQTVAVLNPIPAGASEIAPKGSAENELKDYFKEKKFSIVTDLNLRADRETNYSCKAKVRFDVLVNK